LLSLCTNKCFEQARCIFRMELLDMGLRRQGGSGWGVVGVALAGLSSASQRRDLGLPCIPIVTAEPIPDIY